MKKQFWFHPGACHFASCIIILLLATVPIFGNETASSTPRKIGVLLVNHGSRSATWRNALQDLEQKVRPTLSTNEAIKGIKTAFMEYTEPSIATRLKEFDAEGFTDIVLTPIFLTVSPHTFDDIPTIIGKKIDPQSLEMLKQEKIERYTPCAKVVITPNLDFANILQKNVQRRAATLSQVPAEEGLVLIAYGDTTYEEEWTALLKDVAEYVRRNLGIETYSHGWCGHVARYSPDETTKAINKVLETKSRALVIPVLVAQDETFQVKIIGGGIAKVSEHQDRVVYRPDAILPDEDVEQWVISIVIETVAKIETSFVARHNGTNQP